MQIAMLAADFTAGEADALRRAMAAWKRRGGLTPVPRAPGRPDDREGLRARVRRAHLQADPGLRRIRLSREPRRRLRAARLRQQLDQVPPPRRLPLRPAQRPADGLLRAGAAGARRARARRRGAPGRRRDERLGERARRRAAATRLHPVRLGLDRVGGLAEEAGRRIVAARAEAGPFASAEDLARRARLDAPRPRPRWPTPTRCRASPATATRRRGRSPASTPGRPSCCARPASTRTPVAPRRAGRGRGDAGRLPLARPDAEPPPAGAAARAAGAPSGSSRRRALRTFPNGRLARASGLVTHRQRPETAKGTVFVTLEDETGAVNVIVWPRIAEQQRKPLLGGDAAHRLRPVADARARATRR